MAVPLLRERVAGPASTGWVLSDYSPTQRCDIRSNGIFALRERKRGGRHCYILNEPADIVMSRTYALIVRSGKMACLVPRDCLRSTDCRLCRTSICGTSLDSLVVVAEITVISRREATLVNEPSLLPCSRSAWWLSENRYIGGESPSLRVIRSQALTCSLLKLSEASIPDLAIKSNVAPTGLDIGTDKKLESLAAGAQQARKPG